jgi:alkyldihydroxyacetonephosphate synthase
MESLRQILRAGWEPAVTRLYDAMEAGRNFRTTSEGKPILLILSEGPRGLVDAEAAAARAIIERNGGRAIGEEPVRSWLEHRNHVPSFSSLLEQGLVVDTIEVAVGWDRLAALYDDVVAAGAKIDGMIAMSGHVSHCYTQGANIYFTFVAAHGGDLNKALDIYDRAWDVTMRSTHAAGGTVAHHHGIGRVRKKWLRAELGEAYDVLVRVKRALDPNGVMNPGALLDVR